MGALVINGLVLPRGKFDPLAKIWSTVRKRIREQFHVDVAGLFLYDDEKEVISCSFYLNYCVPELKDIDAREYTERFEGTFALQMIMFEEAVEYFLLDDEHGYEPYLERVKQGADEQALNNMFNAFLRSINLRTPKDDKKARRKAKARQRAKQAK